MVKTIGCVDITIHLTSIFLAIVKFQNIVNDEDISQNKDQKNFKDIITFDPMILNIVIFVAITLNQLVIYIYYGK